MRRSLREALEHAGVDDAAQQLDRPGVVAEELVEGGRQSGADLGDGLVAVIGLDAVGWRYTFCGAVHICPV